jgi:undecaprenyl-diphosphatase
MTLSWLQSIIFGFLSGLTDILPVSSQAHKAIMLQMFGADYEPPIMRLMIHLATFAALYYSCNAQIQRIMRQRRLARVPKKRRKRPVDVQVLMDFRLLCTMVVPVVLGFLFYQKASVWNMRLNWIAVFSIINAVILYLPVLLPSGNKDSRNMTPLEGLFMGAGGAISILPGVSSVGGMTAVGSLCGGDRVFVLNIALLIQMVITAAHIVFDVLYMITVGAGAIGFGILLCYILAAAAAFAGVYLAIRIMRTLAVNIGYNGFAYYSLGLGLLSFIFYLQV